ncbi:MAG TPA: diaminopimelate decarboxylase [Gaiellaceae bacterium]|nr:diaminopimelate decarboxylase [Gaiellaceae bacterium]
MLELLPDTAEIRDGVLWVGGCSTVSLAEEYGTPLVVYCEETIRSAARAWRTAAPDAAIVFGTKAFPNVPIMGLLAEEGIGADVSTLGELRYAQAAGVPSSALVVHGNNKSDEELAAAAEADAWLVVMDEPGEVERCAAAGVRRVLLRITPGIEAGGHEKIMTGHLGSKFGVAPEEALEIVGRARAAGLEMLGLHVHLGSQVTDPAAARSTVELLAGLCVEARRKLDWTPAIVNLGGGLGIRYVMDDPAPPTPEEYTRAVSERLVDVWAAADLPQPALIFEPGRSLVGRAGLTLYRIGVVKRSGATTWVAVDGGMSDNPRPALYGARYSALVANRADEAPAGAYAVCGKHCESGDVLIEHAELADPRRDDVLAVPGTGAYSLSMASNYNALPRPAALLASDGAARVISSRDRAGSGSGSCTSG